MADPAPNTVTVTVKPHGPLLVSGPITLVDPTGKTVPTVAGKITALCRCGHSSMKPFCDGSHTRMGFQASEAAPVR